jgi:sorbitol-specific phosphotransferase system component IIC
MDDLLHSAAIDIWVVFAGGAIFIAFVTGLKPRVVWGLCMHFTLIEQAGDGQR